jgi:hypothetical protein
MLILILLFFFITFIIISREQMSDKIPCIKWEGEIKTSPSNICKDCGYPIDCHGPYMGELWRHIFISEIQDLHN